MCDLIEKLFLDIKPEKIVMTIDENEVMNHYDKDKDELLVMIGKLKAENYNLTQRIVALDMFFKEIVGEFMKENKPVDDIKLTPEPDDEINIIPKLEREPKSVLELKHDD